MTTTQIATDTVQIAIDKLNLFSAVMIAEGEWEMAGVAEEDQQPEVAIAAWQLLVDDGIVWQLQGAFGRQAAAMIEAGLITT